MPDAIVTVLTGAGVAGIWLLSIIFGLMSPKSHVDDLRAQIEELKANLATERARAEAAVEAAQTSNLLLAGIRKEVGH